MCILVDYLKHRGWIIINQARVGGCKFECSREMPSNIPSEESKGHYAITRIHGTGVFRHDLWTTGYSKRN